ncbi:hypothetical protein PSAC2689_70180 [Paraburkholderia sacchari]
MTRLYVQPEPLARRVDCPQIAEHDERRLAGARYGGSLTGENGFVGYALLGEHCGALRLFTALAVRIVDSGERRPATVVYELTGREFDLVVTDFFRMHRSAPCGPWGRRSTASPRAGSLAHWLRTAAPGPGLRAR